MDEQTVVIDNGTGYTKIGYAGEEAPKQIYKTAVISQDDPTNITYPMQYGLIQDWDAMEKVWQHGFKNFLGQSYSAADHPVLLSEVPLAPKSHRERMTQAMFEGFEVPGMFVANQGVLALYAAGRITGVVLDVGHAVSKFVPIQEGFVLTHAAEKTNWAGQNVTLFLKELIRNELSAFPSQSDQSLTFDDVQKIKDDLSFVDSNYNRTLDTLQKQKSLALVNLQSLSTESGSTDGSAPTEVTPKKKTSSNNAVEYFKNYTLPDGKIIQIGQIERMQCNEILFNPQLISSKKLSPQHVRPSYHGRPTDELDELGIQTLLADSIAKCEIDIKKELAGNVILCGGATEAIGFQKRIQIEMEQLMPTMYPINIAPVGSATNSKQIAVWSGGAILAQLSSFNSMWIKKSEYNEYGPQIVQRRTY
jgi:actin